MFVLLLYKYIVLFSVYKDRSTLRRLTLNAELFFFEGQCTSETAQAQIADNFIAALKNNIRYQQTVCPDMSTTCSSNNVQVSSVV